MTEPTRTTVDQRFGEADAAAMPWPDVEALLTGADVYQVSTVHTSGHPHVTPVVGIWHDDAFHFAVGPAEQKARNIDRDPRVAVSTGSGRWNAGTDVVVEGEATRVVEPAAVREVADAFYSKYGEAWRYEPGDGGFGAGDDFAWLVRVAPRKVIVFAKDPHAQTTHRFR